MSGHPHTIQLPPADRLRPGKHAATTILFVLGLAGIVLSVIGAVTNPEQFAYSWFFAFYFFFTIAISITRATPTGRSSRGAVGKMSWPCSRCSS